MEYILKITLKNGENIVINEENIPALLENNILSFQLNDMNHSVNLQTKEFLRENDEYAFLLDIENQKSQITLKKEQYNVTITQKCP